MTQPLTLELRSAHFDLQSAKATLVRVPEGLPSSVTGAIGQPVLLSGSTGAAR